MNKQMMMHGHSTTQNQTAFFSQAFAGCAITTSGATNGFQKPDIRHTFILLRVKEI